MGNSTHQVTSSAISVSASCGSIFLTNVSQSLMCVVSMVDWSKTVPNSLEAHLYDCSSGVLRLLEKQTIKCDMSNTTILLFNACDVIVGDQYCFKVVNKDNESVVHCTSPIFIAVEYQASSLPISPVNTLKRRAIAEVGSKVWYQKTINDAPIQVAILDCHKDDLIYYYTIDIAGKSRQTEETYLHINCPLHTPIGDSDIGSGDKVDVHSVLAKRTRQE